MGLHLRWLPLPFTELLTLPVVHNISHSREELPPLLNYKLMYGFFHFLCYMHLSRQDKRRIDSQHILQNQQSAQTQGKIHAGTYLICSIRHREGEGICMLFSVTSVNILDAARGQVCLAERTDFYP